MFPMLNVKKPSIWTVRRVEWNFQSSNIIKLLIQISNLPFIRSLFIALLEMCNLDVLHLQLLVVARLPGPEEMPPVTFVVWLTSSSSSSSINSSIQWVHHYVMRRVEEEGNREPLLLRVRSHSVLHALVLIVAPHLRLYVCLDRFNLQPIDLSN